MLISFNVRSTSRTSKKKSDLLDKRERETNGRQQQQSAKTGREKGEKEVKTASTKTIRLKKLWLANWERKLQTVVSWWWNSYIRGNRLYLLRVHVISGPLLSSSRYHMPSPTSDLVHSLISLTKSPFVIKSPLTTPSTMSTNSYLPIFLFHNDSEQLSLISSSYISTVSTLVPTPSLQYCLHPVSSLHYVCDQSSFVFSYYISKLCFHHLLCNTLHSVPFDPFNP